MLLHDMQDGWFEDSSVRTTSFWQEVGGGVNKVGDLFFSDLGPPLLLLIPMRMQYMRRSGRYGHGHH